MTNQPQILHISTVHPALDARIFYKELRALRDAGYKVALAGTVERPQEQDGIAILPLGSRDGERWRRIGRDVRAMLVMLTHPESILQIHDPELLVAALIPALLGYKVVYDVHEFCAERIAESTWIPFSLRNSIARAYERIEGFALRRFAGVVIVSEAMREHYAKLVGNKRVALVRNFPYVSSDDLAAAAATPHPLAGSPYILHTGGASHLGAFHTTVAAAEYLRDHGCTWPIVNLGPVDLSAYGTEAPYLLARAKYADVRNVGMVSQETAWRYVAHANIGLIPQIAAKNNERGMPNKLFEMMLFGLPLVASDVGVVASTIRGAGAGLLAAPEDAVAHGQALLTLITNEQERAAMADGARAAGAAFSFANELASLEELYGRLVQRRSDVVEHLRVES